MLHLDSTFSVFYALVAGCPFWASHLRFFFVYFTNFFQSAPTCSCFQKRFLTFLPFYSGYLYGPLNCYSHNMEAKAEGFCFSSNFDSGNLAKVESTTPTKQGKLPNSPIPDYEFNLWTKVDAANTEHQNSFRSWFFFSVKGSSQPAVVRFNIQNLNKHSKVFTNNMYPVYMICGQNRWQRIREKPVFMDVGENSIMSFVHHFKSLEKIFFALCYPYPYKDVVSFLSRLDTKFGCLKKTSFNSEDIYYYRECLCYSLEGRSVDLITITSPSGISREREPRLKNLFPEVEVPRPHAFPNKKVIFITARVHPAETSSSFVLDGIITSLINKDDPGAAQLRKKFLFKLIPVLNPDGVVRGHYRTDSRGVNLNRVYTNPCVEFYPTIHATCTLIRYYHKRPEKIDTATYDQVPEDSFLLVDGQIPNPDKEREFSKKKDNNAEKDKQSKLFLYLDLHSHASRKGFFLYGNNFSTIDDCVETRVFAKLMEINCKSFTYEACDFSESLMYIRDKSGNGSRDGTGRVWVMKETGITYSYTFEAHYNTGQVETCIPRKGGKLESKHWISYVPAEFSAPTYEGVGRAILQSILDLNGPNTWSQLYTTNMKSLIKIRDSLRKELSDKAAYHKNVAKTLKPVVRVAGLSAHRSTSQALLKTGVQKKRPETRSENYIAKDVSLRQMEKEKERAQKDSSDRVENRKLNTNNENVREDATGEPSIFHLIGKGHKSPKHTKEVDERLTKKSDEHDCAQYVPPVCSRSDCRMDVEELKLSSELNKLNVSQAKEESLQKEDSDCCPPF